MSDLKIFNKYFRDRIRWCGVDCNKMASLMTEKDETAWMWEGTIKN
jgi:hypothetical protein